jgi:hypothetical protein
MYAEPKKNAHFPRVAYEMFYYVRGCKVKEITNTNISKWNLTFLK